MFSESMCIAGVGFSFSPSKVLQILKGLSAKLFFGHHEKARLRYPRGHLWSRGKFDYSAGFVQLDVMKSYVRNQDHAMETAHFSVRKKSS